MNKFTTLLLASVCAGSLLTGCAGKDGDPGPAGPAGQTLAGNIFGFVNPVDEAGNPVSKSGITVSLEGVTPAATVSTDANGRFEFTGLRSGTYNLSYARTDLGSYRRIGVGHVGGDQPTFAFTTTMSQPSSTRITSLSAAPSPANGTVSLQMTIANSVLPVNSFARYVVYIGANANVTSSTGLLYANTIYGATLQNGGVASASVTLNRAALNGLGFSTGTPVYVVVYGISSSFGVYTDPTNGRNVYTGLSTSPSSVAAFFVP